MVREFLDERAIAYSVRRVGTDPEASAAFLARGWRLPPVVEVGAQAIEGYQPEALEAALGF